MSVTLGEVETPIGQRILDSLTVGTYKTIELAPAPSGTLPQDGEKPSVYYQVVEIAPHERQIATGDIEDITFTIEVVGRRSSPMSECTDLLKRLYGNADPNGIDPTRGFQRHKLTGFSFDSGEVSQDAKSTDCLRVSEVPNHDADFWRAVQTWVTTVSRR